MSLQKYLDLLTEKYDLPRTASLVGETLTFEGKVIPLLPWRCERRFVELRNLVNDGTLDGVSALRISHVAPKGTDLKILLYRELDLCQWILGRKIREIMTFTNGETSNTVAELDGGAVCTVELAATLAEGTPDVDKHEITARVGVACDRVVDTQVPQSSIYFYSDKPTPETFTDVDFELFGLSAADVATVRAAQAALADPALADALIAADKELTALVKLSAKSAESGENLKVGDAL